MISLRAIRLWSGAHPAVVHPAATLTAVGTYLAGRRAWRRIDDDPFTDCAILTDRHAVVLAIDGCHGHAVAGGQQWAIRSRRGLLRLACTDTVRRAAGRPPIKTSPVVGLVVTMSVTDQT
jgi:hypothetical protein